MQSLKKYLKTRNGRVGPYRSKFGRVWNKYRIREREDDKSTRNGCRAYFTFHASRANSIHTSICRTKAGDSLRDRISGWMAFWSIKLWTHRRSVVAFRYAQRHFLLRVLNRKNPRIRRVHFVHFVGLVCFVWNLRVICFADTEVLSLPEKANYRQISPVLRCPPSPPTPWGAA